MPAGALPIPPLDWRSLRRLVVVFGLSLAAVQSARVVKCERHLGPFLNGPFTSAYDINNLECRLSEVATLRLWTVPPYVDVALHRPR